MYSKTGDEAECMKYLRTLEPLGIVYHMVWTSTWFNQQIDYSSHFLTVYSNLLTQQIRYAAAPPRFAPLESAPWKTPPMGRSPGDIWE